MVYLLGKCSNPGHPFCSGVTLAKLAAVTVDETGNETFVASGALERLRKVSFTHLFMPSLTQNDDLDNYFRFHFLLIVTEAAGNDFHAYCLLTARLGGDGY